jgi:uncharacterized membrane protein YGL010W
MKRLHFTEWQFHIHWDNGSTTRIAHWKLMLTIATFFVLAASFFYVTQHLVGGIIIQVAGVLCVLSYYTQIPKR